MSGVAVIRYLLANNATVIAIAPATRIMAGELPLNTVVPAIEVTQVSSFAFAHITANNDSPRLNIERVQVRGLVKSSLAYPGGADYPGLVALMKAVSKACPNQRATVNGVALDSITVDIEGPDFTDMEIGTLSRTRDFIVRWTE